MAIATGILGIRINTVPLPYEHLQVSTGLRTRLPSGVCWELYPRDRFAVLRNLF